VLVHISRPLAGPDEWKGFTLLESDDAPLENIGKEDQTLRDLHHEMFCQEGLGRCLKTDEKPLT
jgi:hypothetical protein